ncbi:DUF1805 domain-containing protein [Bacillaceae bacterium SIJ1]|uniref:YunC family protein n=1 Tax=Litoribacterium kuwaitense TaxID=1398745 RepID=UPI0013E9EDC4|nr:DUF1805 domain-containing protein [Litoribacterium kuwaitense]NGP46174.1 DUF1805 domain-containing protein [Litoribacterium kuwaitense]
MVTMTPIDVEGHTFTAVTVRLPKTNFMAVTGENGYVMCGALDVALLNEKLADRRILAGRAVGVRTIDDLLNAPLESVTDAAKEQGVDRGMSVKEALILMNG